MRISRVSFTYGKDKTLLKLISKLFVYPIKSIRGCEVQSALLTREGFHLDRRFMLLKSNSQTPGPRKLENMHITRFPAMCLFHTYIIDSRLVVSYTPVGAAIASSTIEIPLEPENWGNLEKVEVNMHSSVTTSYDMGDKYNAWFSEHFGFPVVLAFWGLNPRLVLGNLPFQLPNIGPESASPLTKFISSLPVIGPFLTPQSQGVIAFNDCAPYLVISDTSVDDVSARLPDDISMDLTKFRANIVVTGAKVAYNEDFWSELTFSPLSPNSPVSVTTQAIPSPKIILTSNCGRCASLNVDYTTGCHLTNPSTQPLKLLQKDRRVDPGMKYSPIFGRYGFASKESEGSVLRIGDIVSVSRVNKERTIFCKSFRVPALDL
jgi:uncharacterized protein YcbX